MSEQTSNFLGIPIDGDINRASKRTPQQPITDLEPLMRAVLDDEGIADFGWRQYTPYFNDGDPCEFTIGEPWFRTVGDVKPGDEDAEPDDAYALELSGHPSLATERWDSQARNYVQVSRDAETVARYERCKALADAIGSGAFEHVLLDAFGDHCYVRIRRAGIVIHAYDHD